MNSYQDVSCYLLSNSHRFGVTISNMKLQKLMYYAQGFSLALNNKALFDEEISAWDHGPVIDPLYHQYKQYGSSTLPTTECNAIFSDSAIGIMDQILETFGSLSAWTLREMTHKEKPWLDHSISGDKGDSTKISKDEIKSFFASKFNMQEYLESFKGSLSDLQKEEVITIPENIKSASEFILWVRSKGKSPAVAC